MSGLARGRSATRGSARRFRLATGSGWLSPSGRRQRRTRRSWLWGSRGRCSSVRVRLTGRGATVPGSSARRGSSLALSFARSVRIPKVAGTPSASSMIATSTCSRGPAPPSGSDSLSTWCTPASIRTAASARRALRRQRDGQPSPLGYRREEPTDQSGVWQRVGAGGRPAAVHLAHRARRRPHGVLQSGARLRPAPARMGPRPVIRGGQPAVLRLPRQYCLAHPLACPLPRDRAGMTLRAIGVRVALAVSGRRRSAAALAHSPIAALYGACLLARRV